MLFSGCFCLVYPWSMCGVTPHSTFKAYTNGIQNIYRGYTEHFSIYLGAYIAYRANFHNLL